MYPCCTGKETINYNDLKSIEIVDNFSGFSLYNNQQDTAITNTPGYEIKNNMYAGKFMYPEFIYHLRLVRNNGSFIKLWTTIIGDKNLLQQMLDDDDKIARSIWNKVQPIRDHVSGSSSVKHRVDWKPMGKLTLRFG